ncbi:MAG: hypothetical protein JJT96_14035 [Opitutales bacterium]|nr:hypothetical protein [Opitutales bacterium]
MNSKFPSAPSTPEGAPPAREGFRPVLTIGFGLLLVAVLTPLTQFLTILTVNTVVETSTPAGWAMGIIFSLALTALALRSLARRNLCSRAELALLYTMLAIAVPVMNLGLVRPFYNATHAVLREYVYQGTSTYRTAYNVLDENWFPKIPTREGYAWNRADRLLRLLEDGEALRRQREARRQLTLALTDELILRDLLEKAASDPNHPDLQTLRAHVDRLGLDGAQDVRATGAPENLAALGLEAPLAERARLTGERSAALRAELGETLMNFGEWEASLLESNLAAMDFSARQRLDEATNALSDEVRARLLGQRDRLAEREAHIRSAVSALGFGDRAELRRTLVQNEGTRVGTLSQSAFDEERNSFMFRLSRSERRALMQQDGTEAPNQNLWAFEYSIWSDTQAREVRDRNSFWTNFGDLVDRLPWGLYLRPLFLWGFLFLSIYFFLMCLAEFLRRKWVSRENLSFPLVELADNIIRHDYRLESSNDPLNPERRSGAFNSLAMIGFAVGFIMLFFEAMSHYGFLGMDSVIYFDFNDSIFNPAGGAMREIPAMVFVLSPIIIGIVFLLSLEVAFSIWATFLLYIFISWVVRLANPTLADSNWTGFGDGRFHPFPMEQMLGACLVFAVFMLWKARSNAAYPKTATERAEAYLPPALTRWGLLLLPPLIFVLLWSTGVKSISLILALSIATLAIAVAAARVRAETGLPTFHVFYESTKLPIVLGLTGISGAKAYAAFINVVFLPMTLLFRTLPQQLENMELARRHRIPYRTVAWSGLLSFVMALAVGMTSFLLFVYAIGQDFYGQSALPPQSGSPSAAGLATYPLWVSHFLGEPGLDRFDQINWLRVGAMGVGAAVIGILLFCRQKFLRFPLHPVGYLVVLLSIHYAWVSPYMRTDAPAFIQASTLWGGAFVAWLIKKLIVKYGGMNSYKRAKPFFIGLVVGAVVCVFFWNSLHLFANLYASFSDSPGDFVRPFREFTPYIPSLY